MFHQTHSICPSNDDLGLGAQSGCLGGDGYLGLSALSFPRFTILKTFAIGGS